MTYLKMLMSTLLLAFLVMSASADQRYGRPSASENDRDDFILDHEHDDYEILTDQGMVNEQLDLPAKSLPMQVLSNHRTIQPLGRRTTTKLPIKPRTTTRRFTTKKPTVVFTRPTLKPRYLECGKSIHHGKIYGGHNVNKEGKFPWKVELLAKVRDGFSVVQRKCGGTIISDRHILTTAHCFPIWMKPSNVVVRLGDSSLNSTHVSPSRRDVAVSKIFRHEGFNDKTMINDIAIFQLKEKIVWNDMVRPICLPTAASALNLEGRKATVAGWGDRSPHPQFLMQVDVPIIGVNYCKKSVSVWYDLMEHYFEIIPARKPIAIEQICTGYPFEEIGSCEMSRGDLGGPLMFQADHKSPWTVIGVFSWGGGCGRQGPPGVYTRVSSYIYWIRSKMAIK